MLKSAFNNGVNSVIVFFVKNSSLIGIVLVGLVAVSVFLTGFGKLDIPILEHGGEIQRDYMTARHISEYGELVYSGPWNGFLSSIGNSPLYFYVLAFFTTIYDDLVFLNLVSILLFALTIFLVYFTAKSLFNTLTGLLAALLFAFGYDPIYSKFVWMPSMMLPVVNISYLLLVLSYRKNSFALLLSAVATLATAIALHNSVIPLIPLFLLFVFLILKKQHRPKRYYIYAAAVFMVTLAIFYLPVALYTQSGSYSHKESLFKNVFVSSFGQFLNNLKINTILISQNVPIITLFLMALLTYSWAYKDTRENKKLFYLILAFAIQPIVLASLTDPSKKISGDGLEIFQYYFLPIYSPIAILAAQIINSLLSRQRVLAVLKFILIILLVNIFAFKFVNAQKPQMRNRANVASAVEFIKSEVDELKKQNNLKRADFFQIRAYGDQPGFLENIFLAPLEKEMSQRLVKIKKNNIDNQGNRGYEVINTNDYIFLVCIDLIDKVCKYKFETQNKGYSISPKAIYSQNPFKNPFKIYLAQKLSN